MFFYSGYSVLSVAVALGLVAALFFLNEISRRNKYVGIAMYLVLPIVLTIFVWPKTAANSTWFAWVKTYSALAGVLGFMAFRYVKSIQTKKAMILFPAVILIVNIIEAIIRDFEVYGLSEAARQSEALMSGPWNIMNGVAGILLVLSMSGFLGVKIANTKTKDMVWLDQMWFWIIAYDLWNFAFCYNTIPLRSFYTGPLLNLTPVFISVIFCRGTWLQNRAQTLALFAMFSLFLPRYDKMAAFSITSTANPTAMLVMSGCALAVNIAIFVYAIFTIVKTKKNPLTQDIYSHLDSYKKIAEINNISIGVEAGK